MSSDEDTATLMAAFKKKAAPGFGSNAISFQPINQHSRRASSSKARTSDNESILRIQTPPVKRRLHSVRIPPVNINRAEYTYYEVRDEVERVVREFSGKDGDVSYEVQVTGNRLMEVSSTSYEGCSLTGKGARLFYKITQPPIPSALSPLLFCSNINRLF